MIRDLICFHKSSIIILKPSCLNLRRIGRRFNSITGIIWITGWRNILYNLAGMLFCYLDSGDFMICFDPGKNNPEEIRCIASEILAPDEGRKENREGSTC